MPGGVDAEREVRAGQHLHQRHLVCSAGRSKASDPAPPGAQPKQRGDAEPVQAPLASLPAHHGHRLGIACQPLTSQPMPMASMCSVVMPLSPPALLMKHRGNDCPPKARGGSTVRRISVHQGQYGEDAVLGVVGEAYLQAVEVPGGIDKTELEGGALGIVDRSRRWPGRCPAPRDRPQLRPARCWSG